MGGVMQPVAPGLTGRSTRTRSGIAPQGVLMSVRLAAQCHCMLVNSDVSRHGYELRSLCPTPVEQPDLA